MNESVLKDRFFRFAIAIYALTKEFPKKTVYFVLERQTLKSSSSSGANYRAACRGKSRPDFINKLRIVEEELDETLYWLEYLNGVNVDFIDKTAPLWKEGNELISITIASITTALRHQYKTP